MLTLRPLRPAELALVGCFAGRVRLDRVRIVTGGRLLAFLTRGSAVALGHYILAPRRLTLPVLAHELTHVYQYERWGALRYFARGAWHQLVRRGLFRRDVYAWEASDAGFEHYGMEQQGQIVQDCFDPTSPRRAAAGRLSPFTPGGEIRTAAPAGGPGRPAGSR